MKASIFNFSYERSDGSYVLFNTFSKAVIAFDEKNKFEEILNDCQKMSEESQALYANGMIVSDETDELALLKYFHYKAKFSSEHLILTVAPTMQCNFACPYCYETPHSGQMEKDVQDALVDFIREKIQEGARDIDLTWYGGEPLLYPDIIDRVSSAVATLAEAYQAKASFTMVTNGSLLTKDIVAMLEKNKIHSIQITLDGLAENHNARRPYRGGQGSFERIFNNLRLFAGTKIRVNIRMNVDKQNKEDYAALRRMIESLRPEVEISIYPAIVEHLNKDDLREDIYLSGAEYSDFLTDCYGDTGEEAENIALSRNRRYFCTAELENCYVVDEKGNLYKCWDEIGKEEFVCMNLLNRTQPNYCAIAHFVADDPFDANSKCRMCKFLPLCFGGCRYQKNYFGQTKCSFTSAGIIQYIENKFFDHV